MIKSKLAVLSLGILLVIGSCYEENPAKNINSGIINPQDSLVSLMVRRFNLPYSADLKLDSSSLIFFGNRTFDTSFLVHFIKQENKISGTYYEVLPNYHRSLNDVRTPNNQILFFEGYSFALDSTRWNIIKRVVERIMPTDTSRKSKPPVLDGNTYVLCYNFRISKSNPYSINQYELFYTFLKDTLLDDLNKKRIPIMRR